MKAKKVYYTVFGLKDGTVFAVLAIPKPRKSKHLPAPKIDAEGVCRFHVEDDVAPGDMPDWQRTTFHTTTATALNMKRILREQVAGRLDTLEKAVAETREQLARIEDKLDQLIRANARPGPS